MARKLWDPTKAAKEQAGHGLIAAVSPSTASQRRVDSDLVYQTNKWHRYQYSEFAQGSEEAALMADQGSKGMERWPAYMREVFTRLYAENAQRLPAEDVRPTSGWAEQAHEVVEELPEFKRLQDRCRGDRLWSGVSSTALAESVLQALPEPSEQIRDSQSVERLLQGYEQLQAAGVPCEAEQAEARKRMQQMQQTAQNFQQQMDPSAMRHAMRQGIQKANTDIDQAQATLDAFGWGNESGSAGRGGDLEQKRKLMERVGRSEKLKALAELAGRMRRVAAAQQRSKADYRRDEISDITHGDDLARLLPVETLKLSDPDFEALFFQGLMERSLLNYELKGQAPQGRGPIVVCIDNSGSMAGDREVWSKAVALAMLDIARKENRSFAVLHFCTEVGCKLVWERGPNPPSWEHVCELMEYFSGGGTNFEPVLKEALTIVEEDQFTKADIVLITDGAAGTSFAEDFRRRCAQKEVRTYGIEIGGWGGETALDNFCDKVMQIDDVSGPNSATDVVFEI